MEALIPVPANCEVRSVVKFLIVSSLQRLKMEALIPVPANCKVRSVVKFLTVSSLQRLKMEALIPVPANCEVRSVVKFLNAQSRAQIEIHRHLCQVYEPKVMNKHMVRRWCRQFTEDRQHMHDEGRSGRSSIITDDLVERVREPRVL